MWKRWTLVAFVGAVLGVYLVKLSASKLEQRFRSDPYSYGQVTLSCGRIVNDYVKRDRERAMTKAVADAEFFDTMTKLYACEHPYDPRVMFFR